MTELVLKMWAPDHKDGCHLALLDGRTFMVPHDKNGIDVPKAFCRAALARGCIPIDIEPEETDADTLDQAPTIRGAEKRAVADSGTMDDRTHQADPTRGPAPDPGALARPEMTGKTTAADHTAGTSLGDPVAAKIAHELQRAGESGRSRTVLRDLFGRNVPAQRIQAALALLQINGLAKRESVRSGGRPSEVWRYAK